MIKCYKGTFYFLCEVIFDDGCVMGIFCDAGLCSNMLTL